MHKLKENHFNKAGWRQLARTRGALYPWNSSYKRILSLKTSAFAKTNKLDKKKKNECTC